MVDRQLCPDRSSQRSLFSRHDAAKSGANNNGAAEQLADAVGCTIDVAHRRPDRSAHGTPCRRYRRSHRGSVHIAGCENESAHPVAHPAARDSSTHVVSCHDVTDGSSHTKAIDPAASDADTSNAQAYNKQAIRLAIGRSVGLAFYGADENARNTVARDQGARDASPVRRAIGSAV